MSNTERQQCNGVDHPLHYNRGIETWDYTDSHDMCFLQGNIVKYVTRYKDKDGVKDLKKAKAYLDRLITREESRASIAANQGLSPVTYPEIRLEDRGKPVVVSPLTVGVQAERGDPGEFFLDAE